MNLRENIRESIRSMRLNMLRTILTVLTIGVGITCLVGILTAVEAMRMNYLNEYARLGVNSFTIQSVRNWRNRRRGIIQKDVPPLKYSEALTFINRYDTKIGRPSLRVSVTGRSELSRGQQKTYPNINISGVDDHYIFAEFLTIEEGRNFTRKEIEDGSPVAIIGDEVYTHLFKADEYPIGSHITALGTRYNIIGQIKKVGSSNRRQDQMLLIPLPRALQKIKQSPRLRIIVQVYELEDIEDAAGLGMQLMRNIRGDKPQKEASFELRRNTAVEERINKESNRLRLVGYIIGSITLIAGCIGLMNIMLIYVKERTREIGIRKAVGATAYEIRMQFLTESICICQIGCVVGAFFGLLIGNGTAVALNADVIFPLTTLLIAVLISTLVGVLSGYIPAQKAAAVDPITSIRYEK